MDATALDVFLDLYFGKICDAMPKISAQQHRITLERLWRDEKEEKNVPEEYAVVFRFPLSRIRQTISQLVSAQPSTSSLLTPQTIETTTTTTTTTAAPHMADKFTYKQQLMIERFLYEVKKHPQTVPPHVYEAIMNIYVSKFVEPIEIKSRQVQLIVTQFLHTSRERLTPQGFSQLHAFAQSVCSQSRHS